MSTRKKTIDEFQKQANALDAEIRLLQKRIIELDEPEIREFISLFEDMQKILSQHQRSAFVFDEALL